MTEAMGRYELILELEPDLSAARQKKILDKAKNLITSLGGKVNEVKSRGLTNLAYPVGGSHEAVFTHIPLSFDQEKGVSGRSKDLPLGEKISSLQKELQLVKGILRLMVVRGEVKKEK
jgi:ribosomal protein S6